MILVGFWGSREPARGNCISRLGMLGLRGEIDLWIDPWVWALWFYDSMQAVLYESFIYQVSSIFI